MRHFDARLGISSYHLDDRRGFRPAARRRTTALATLNRMQGSARLVRRQRALRYGLHLALVCPTQAVSCRGGERMRASASSTALLEGPMAARFSSEAHSHPFTQPPLGLVVS